MLGELLHTNNMTLERWKELMQSDTLELTQDEIKQGWHFCPCWDGLLIGEGSMETEFCYCEDWKK